MYACGRLNAHLGRLYYTGLKCAFFGTKIPQITQIPLVMSGEFALMLGNRLMCVTSWLMLRSMILHQRKQQKLLIYNGPKHRLHDGPMVVVAPLCFTVGDSSTDESDEESVYSLEFN